MLESIKVTERLHWPEVEMSQKYILNSAEALSPSQVYLEKISCSVLQDLLGSGAGGFGVLLRAEQDDGKAFKLPPCRRPKTTAKRGSTSGKKNRLGSATRKTRAPEGGGRPPPSGRPPPGRGMAVVGNGVGLAPRPAPQLRKTKRPSRDPEGPQKLCILSAIKPSNLEAEKARFFQSDFSYNPQFEYSSPVSPSVLARHATASDRFLTQAVNIMELALDRYGSYEKFQQVTGGNLLSRSRIWHSVKKYMEKEGCVGEIVVQVTDDLLSRASMTVVNSRPTLTINTATAREHWLEGMLRHEIGTHYFRGINNGQQPWSSSQGRRRLNLKPLNPTEEGLASLHSVLFRKDPTLWRAALLYYTVHQAGRLSFAQLFHSLGRFVQDANTRWDYCVRAKRGQTDTGLPGCFSKDQVYLDGVLKILRYRDKINFPLLMALGKVSFEDVERLKAVGHMENTRIPHFMQDQARYAEQLNKIMAVNRLTDEELKTII
ncbi:uncharacterized protein KIAA0895 [Salarias fasciatus]|uniref:uncharacterized protein KIAA0895 n=1 Tax=Salarias fasciatus TaxID=181472 RepID=UPI0011764DB8|nr:uncharacterized protein KIAA0895-like [Salarias fasciatus]